MQMHSSGKHQKRFPSSGLHEPEKTKHILPAGHIDVAPNLSVERMLHQYIQHPSPQTDDGKKFLRHILLGVGKSQEPTSPKFLLAETIPPGSSLQRNSPASQ
jgi:hypothetical protein